MGVSYKEQTSVYIPGIIVICVLLQVLNLIFSISIVETDFNITNVKEFSFRYYTRLE